MGMLQDGDWVDQWYDTKRSGGRFVRKAPHFRNWITPDGTAGITGEAGFKAEADRYHLYISLACPWAHRTLIFLKLKGLEKMVSVSVVNSFMGDDGWTFQEGEGVIADPINNAEYLYQVYTAAKPDYSGRVTVPVLWDKKLNTIVSNESAEVIRMFNSAFDGIGAKEGDYYPLEQRTEIDAINERIYDTVNNGVYKAGFATTQAAYEEAIHPLFKTLDWLEERLAHSRYLLGDAIAEADWRLFTTLVRFDEVYFGHFKCNVHSIVDYPNLWGYVRELYQRPGISDTVDMQYIKNHYYMSHQTVNPTRIVPLGPTVDFDQPHQREEI